MSSQIFVPPDFGVRIGRSLPVAPRRRAHAGDEALIAQGLSGGQANDAFSNPAARIGFGTQSVAEGAGYELIRWSYDYQLMYTLYRNQWVARRIVDTPAQDMVRAWPTIKSDLEPSDLTKIDQTIRDTQTKAKLLQTLTWARLFGGAGALMVIDGHENRFDEPLDIDTVELGSYKGLIPFDRWRGIYPDNANICGDFNRPLQFNLPEFYRVQSMGGSQGFTVHASRILRFTGPAVPAPEYQAQMYWGISVLEVCFEAMKMRDNMLWNMLGLTFRANLLGYKQKELSQMLSGASTNQQALVAFYQRLEAMNTLLSNQNMMVFDTEGGGLEQVQYAFGGCSELLEQFRYEVSGGAEIPEMRLFGHSPSGLGIKDDPAERLYEEKIAVEQDVNLRPQLDILYQVMSMSTLGHVPDDMELDFPSIRVPGEDEKADLAKSVADSVISVFGAGLISKELALQELKQSSKSTGQWTNITNEVIESAKKEDEENKKLKDASKYLGGEESAEGPAAEAAPGTVKPKRTKLSIAADSAHRDLEFSGFPITVEYDAGTRRQIRNERDQLVYDRLLKYDYGFIRNTLGRDGDEVDVILGPAEAAPFVYIVDMEDLGPDVHKREDEDKICLGFQSQSSAERAFLSMYPPSFLRDIEEVPIEEFRERLAEADGRALDEYDLEEVGDPPEGLDEFNESEHPREKSGENAGQFTSKGGGSSSGYSGKNASMKMQAAPATKIKPYNEARFRTPKKDEKIPGSVKPETVRFNPDPNADVVMTGVMKQSGKKLIVYSKAYIQRVQAERAKTWPKWALRDLKIPAVATNVRLSADPNADKLAVYDSATGVEYAKYHPRYVAKKKAQKFKQVAKLEAKFDGVLDKLRKRASSRDIDVAQPAQAAMLAALCGIRAGGSQGRETPKDWNNSLFRKSSRPAGVKDLESGISAAIADSKNVEARAWVKSNFYQRDIDAAVDKLVKARKIDNEDAEEFFTRLHWSTQQWPRWATELDRDELPEFGSTGIVALRGEHVQQEGGKTFLRFIGKESKPNEFEISDPDMIQHLLKAKKAAETNKDQAGFLFTETNARDLLNASKSVGADKTKDFRTAVGNRIARSVIGQFDAPKTAKELKRAKLKVGARVARKLCNTPAMAVNAYIDPAIFADWEAGIEED